MEHIKEQNNKKFECHAKQLFLTYPQCELSCEEMLTYFKTKGMLTYYCVAREEHEDKNHHIHAVLKYATRTHIRDPRHFDYKGHHPNFGAVRNQGNAVAYCKKDGKFIENAAFDYTDNSNFIKREADFEAYQRSMAMRALREPVYPIAIHYETIDGKAETYQWMGPGKKQRHLWIVGQPDAGKTTWTEDTLDGIAHYVRPADDKYPYDQYRQEQLITFDDVHPKFEELVGISNVYKSFTRVYGPTRYTCKYWPQRKEMCALILTNQKPQEVYHPKHHEAIEKRVIVLEVKKLFINASSLPNSNQTL